MSLLKVALHPPGALPLPPADPTDALALDPSRLAALAAAQQLDAALDAVAPLPLGEVIRVDRFAEVVQVGGGCVRGWVSGGEGMRGGGSPCVGESVGGEGRAGGLVVGAAGGGRAVVQVGGGA